MFAKLKLRSALLKHHANIERVIAAQSMSDKNHKYFSIASAVQLQSDLKADWEHVRAVSRDPALQNETNVWVTKFIRSLVQIRLLKMESMERDRLHAQYMWEAALWSYWSLHELLFDPAARADPVVGAKAPLIVLRLSKFLQLEEQQRSFVNEMTVAMDGREAGKQDENSRIGADTISMRDAVAKFLAETSKWFAQGNEQIRAAINSASGGRDTATDTALWFEMAPVVWACNLQPVKIIWGGNALERAHQEVARLIDSYSLGEGEEARLEAAHLNRRLDEYLTVWRVSGLSAQGNMPWDEVTGRALSRLGVGQYRPREAGEVTSPAQALAAEISGLEERMNEVFKDTISPVMIMAVSEVVLSIPSFWKDIEKRYGTLMY